MLSLIILSLGLNSQKIENFAVDNITVYQSVVKEKQIRSESPFSFSPNITITQNVDVLKAIDALKPYMLSYEEMPISNQNYELVVDTTYINSRILKFKVTFPDQTTAEYTSLLQIIESDIGEFAAASDPSTGHHAVITQVNSIAKGISASDLMNYYLNKTIASSVESNINFNFNIELNEIGRSPTHMINFYLEEFMYISIAARVIVIDESLIYSEESEPPVEEEVPIEEESPTEEESEIPSIDEDVNNDSDEKTDKKNNNLLDKLRDYMNENPVLKSLGIIISSIIGLMLIYAIFKASKSTIRWLKE